MRICLTLLGGGEVKYKIWPASIDRLFCKEFSDWVPVLKIDGKVLETFPTSTFLFHFRFTNGLEKFLGGRETAGHILTKFPGRTGNMFEDYFSDLECLIKLCA